MEFEWDPAKRAANLKKHRLDFAAAVRVFGGPVLIRRSPYPDEERWLAVGRLEELEITVVYTIRGGKHRIISARRARTDERAESRALHPG